MTTTASQGRRARIPDLLRQIGVEGVDRKRRTIDLVWTTGAAVRRSPFWDEPFDEILEVSPGAVRMDRMRSGRMQFLDSHGVHVRFSGASPLDAVLGRVLTGELVGTEGRATVEIGSGQRAEELWPRIESGELRNVSCRYRIYRFRDITTPADEVRKLLAIDWEPVELSLVDVPGDGAAGIGMRALEIETAGEPGNYGTDCWIEAPMTPTTQGAGSATAERGDSNGTPATPVAAERSATGVVATTATAPAPAAASDATRAAPAAPAPSTAAPAASDATRQLVEEGLRADRARARGIREFARSTGAPATFVEDLVERGVPLSDARVQLVDEWAQRSQREGGAQHSVVHVGADGRREGMRSAIGEALLHRADSARFPQLSDHARNFRGMRLLDMARECLEARGERTGGVYGDDLARRAMQTTSDFPLILGDVAGKVLRRQYEEQPVTWKPITREIETGDFKTIKPTQLSGAPLLKKVLEHGESERGAFTEARETYAVDSYSRTSAVTRTALVNDDLDAFARQPVLWAAAAARTLANLVWSILNDNAAMADGNALFSGAHANDGVQILVNAGDLQELVLLLRKQTGLAGEPLNLAPAWLIVPPELELVAEQLTTDIAPQSSSNVNPWSSKLQPIIEARLGANPARWYIASNPSQIDILEVAYLEGARAPRIETRQGWEVAGVEIKCDFDFGAKAIDWRGITRSVGST